MITPNKRIYINYFDIIDAQRVKGLMNICSELVAKHKPDCLYFLFSSPGGQVDSGIVFYNFLRSLPIEIIMHNTGSIDSIGNVIYVAGKKRFVSPHSTFHFHGVSLQLGKDTSFSLGQITELKSKITEDQNKIAGIICEKTKLSDEELRKLFLEGESKNATFAVDKGIADQIKDPKIPKEAPFITVNFSF